MFEPSFLLWFVPPFVITFLAAAVTIVLAQRGASPAQRMMVMSVTLTIVGGVEAIACPHFWLQLASVPGAIIAAITTVVLFLKQQRERDVIDR